ncbi:putative F-box protein At5g62660 [Prosopis cineraria]|uniref:putative F-box protein At5g62660 n=1 Tax=Prosopis cineraria TaxID=364024 RepID=UPI00240FF9FB|nr:putative F-box protein At5g62660 [Prosopis cineraria]
MAMKDKIASLPQDIIIDILKRLPVKSLLRFQCVCKDWKNLFKTQFFIKEHLRHSTHHPNPPLVLQWRPNQYPRRLGRNESLSNDLYRFGLLDHDLQLQTLQVHQKAPFLDSCTYARILDSSNGLFCVEIYGCDLFPRCFLLWNPAIREFKQVNTIKPLDTTSHYCIGFGFNPLLNDYKIVIIYVKYDVVNRVQVYSLCSGSWKEIEFGNLEGIMRGSNAISVNGALYWMWYKMDVENHDGYDPTLIVSFDIETEVFTFIPIPLSGFNNNYELSLFDNKLALLCDCMTTQYCVELWVLEEGASASREKWNWTKKYTGCPYSCNLYPMAIWKNEIVFRPRRIEYPIKTITSIYLFNLTTNELREFPIPKYYDLCRIFNHVESLISIENLHIEGSL